MPNNYEVTPAQLFLRHASETKEAYFLALQGHLTRRNTQLGKAGEYRAWQDRITGQVIVADYKIGCQDSKIIFNKIPTCGNERTADALLVPDQVAAAILESLSRFGLMEVNRHEGDPHWIVIVESDPNQERPEMNRPIFQQLTLFVRTLQK